METKKVKVLRASKPSYWYAEQIGKIFEVLPFDKINYITTNNEVQGTLQGCILISDCAEVFDYVSTSTAIDPKHYQLPIEPKDFIIKNQLGFCEGNVIKYICRYKQKNGVEDLKKAKQYIDFLIDEYETTSNR